MDFQSAMETFAEAWVAANTQTPLTEAAEAQGILLSQASIGGLPPQPPSSSSNAVLHELTTPADRRGEEEGQKSPGGTAGGIDFRSTSKTAMGVSSKSIPVHCLVEQACGQASEPTVELDSYAIIPSCTPFVDLVRTALMRLGYSSSEVLGAKGAVQIKNWRPLTFDQITDSSEATVCDILGELTTVATLRIKLFSRPKPNVATEVKEKLLQVLLAQSQTLLASSGCPIDQSCLAALSKGRLEYEISEDTRKKFDQWYLQQVFHHCRQVVLHQQQQQQHHQQQSQMENSHGTISPIQIQHHSSGLHSQNRTRIRTSFDPELELPKLHQWFSENQHPSRMQIQQYVRELNSLESRRGRKPLDINNVIYWFKNARAAYKRAEQRFCPDVNGLRSPFSESINEQHGQLERYDLNAHRLLSGSPHSSDEMPGNQKSSYNNIDSGEDATEDADHMHTLDLSIRRPTKNGPADMDVDRRSSCSEDDKLLVKEEPRDSSSEPSLDSSESYDDIVVTEDAHDPTDNNQEDEQCSETQNGTERKEDPQLAQTLGHCPQRQVNCLEERRKRNRTFIDPVSEVPRLEQWFSSNTHPGHSQIVRYTQELNGMPYRQKFPKLEPKNIQFWFKNRRAKCKRLHLASFHNGVDRMRQPLMLCSGPGPSLAEPIALSSQ